MIKKGCKDLYKHLMSDKRANVTFIEKVRIIR